MYCTPARRQTAKKQHQCTNCGEAIEPGTPYDRWMSVDVDKAFSNKLHIECLHSLIDENGAGFWEYSPFGGERPNVQDHPPTASEAGGRSGGSQGWTTSSRRIIYYLLSLVCPTLGVGFNSTVRP